MARKGGKYKAIGRAKDEDTVTAEAAEKARKKRLAALKRLQEIRSRELAANVTLRSEQQIQEEDKKKRIISLLVGGRKNVKKFFQSWIIGMHNSKKERAVRERETCWRRSCDLPPTAHYSLCTTVSQLRSVDFLMPFDLSRQVTESFLDRQLTDGEFRLGASSAARLHASSTSLLSLPGSKGKTFAERHRTKSELPPVSGAWPGWPPMDDSLAEQVTHHGTGKRCLLDRSLMRFRFPESAEERQLFNNKRSSIVHWGNAP
mmetsp:Transcript_24227/g.53785  ORF Transcript_24227/g.53785 Transcript_24227/m.53785 type:complete len:260 (+) Transcript_24227:54-833(+)